MLASLYDSFIGYFPVIVAMHDMGFNQFMISFMGAVPRAKGPLDFLFKE